MCILFELSEKGDVVLRKRFDICGDPGFKSPIEPCIFALPSPGTDDPEDFPHIYKQVKEKQSGEFLDKQREYYSGFAGTDTE